MSWSVSVKSSDKEEIQSKVQAEEMCPEAIKNATEDLLEICPDGKEIQFSTSGHHNDGLLSNASINILVSG